MEIDDVDVPIGGPDAVGKRVEIPCGSLRVVQKEEVRKIFDRCKRDFDASHELERGQMERVKKENLDLFKEKCKLTAALEIERGDNDYFKNRLERLETENARLTISNVILRGSLDGARSGARITTKAKDFIIEQSRLREDNAERLRARVELESRADQTELRRARALLWYLH